MKSNKDQRQKNIEKFHLDVFKSLCSEFPPGTIEVDRENPDFIVNSQTVRIGIEHTQLFKDMKVEDSFMSAGKYGNQEKILRKAMLICEKKGIPPLLVEVLFEFTNKDYSREDINRISKSLAVYIEDLDSRKLLISEIVLRKDDFIKKIDEIEMVEITPGVIKGRTWLKEHRWEVVSVSVTRIKPDFIEEIQHCIEKKNSKFSTYEKCDQCWLLIVVNRSNPAQRFDINENTKNHIYQSAFDRIFYLDLMHRNLVPLSCLRSA